MITTTTNRHLDHRSSAETKRRLSEASKAAWREGRRVDVRRGQAAMSYTAIAAEVARTMDWHVSAERVRQICERAEAKLARAARAMAVEVLTK